MYVRARLPPEALRAVNRRAHVALPRRANGAVKLEDETTHVAVSFTLDRVQDTQIETSEGVALYRGALDGADVIHRVHAEGTEDFVVFEQRPAREELRYSVDVSRVAGLRLVSNTLEFLDDGGSPALRIAPPYVVDARGEHREAKLAISGCAYDDIAAAPWGRKVTSPGADQCAVHVTWAGVTYPVMVDPSWGATGSMATGRKEHTASVLPSGKVLVAGGVGSAGALASAEIFDPAANGGIGAFAASGSMTMPRTSHTASVLPSGKVLVVGGFAGTGYRATAELFDPEGVGAFTATGSMATARAGHTASILPLGKVLITGGEVSPNGVTYTYFASAEIFDPAADGGVGAFAATGSMLAARVYHTSSVLPSGKVLVAGGYNAPGPALTSTELFDATANGGVGGFAAAAPMLTGRSGHTASLLASAKVLLAGGATADAELFDPSANGGAGAFAATGLMTVERVAHTASTLLSGKVLITGGFTGNTITGGGELASAELFDPAANGGAGAFAVTDAPMATKRDEHTASVLPSGKVLVAGGYDGVADVASAEVFGGLRGEPCANGSCLSGFFCVDGFCCDSACDGGSCERCDLPGKEGTCSVAPAGNPGAGPTCAPYLCDGVKASCPTQCPSDAMCSPDSYCAPGGTCQTRKAQGAACTQANCNEPGSCECASGFCVDGVCCDAKCDGGCQACVAVLKQSGDDGTCGPTKDGTDPRNACAPPEIEVCRGDGMCDGAGGCRNVTPRGVACSNDGKVCDGAGNCAQPPSATCDGDHTTTGVNGAKKDCAPYKCTADGTCRASCTSVVDCVAPTVCDTSGACVPPLAANAIQSSGSDGGCAVASAAPRGDTRSVVWITLGVVLGVRRTRARRGRGLKP
jgi:hypothetical protein